MSVTNHDKISPYQEYFKQNKTASAYSKSDFGHYCWTKVRLTKSYKKSKGYKKAHAYAAYFNGLEVKTFSRMVGANRVHVFSVGGTKYTAPNNITTYQLRCCVYDTLVHRYGQ